MGALTWAAEAAILLSGIVTGLSLTGLRLHPGHPCPRPGAGQLLIAALAAGDTAMVLLLLLRCLDGGEVLVIAAAAGAAALAVCLPVTIFPEDADVLRAKSGGRRSRLASCVLTDLWVLALLLAWELWLLFHGAGPVETGFAAAGLVTGVAGCQIACRRAQERFEALIDRQYQQELLSFMQIIRSQRHDFSFHMQAVAGMIHRGEYDQCAQYVQRMTHQVEALNEVLPLADPVVSALLNTFAAIAAEKGVRLEFQLLDPLGEPPCTGYELNTIIGNLLQNALDETERYGEDRRWIHLLVMKRSRKYFIKVSNPCDRDPAEFEAIFMPGYTTKQTHEGIGLVTVRRLTEKYGGAVYLEHEPGVIHFVARLPVRDEKRKR